MNNIMLDLETMGTSPGCPILSIGAVYFDPVNGRLGDEFYAAIQLVDSVRQGFKPEGATIEWWLKQSDEARDALFKNPLPVVTALIKFKSFVNSPKVAMWAKGPSFDCVILRKAYEMMGIDEPWYFRGDRDMRTLEQIAKYKGVMIPSFPRTGTHHNALDDAKYQAKTCLYVLERL